MRLLLFLALAIAALAQTPAQVGTCTGGAVWGPGVAGYDPASGPLRYGTSFDCTLQAPPGFYMAKLTFIDPTKTAAGQRTFTVSAGGVTSLPIDVIAQSGGRKNSPMTLELPVLSGGTVKFSFRTINGQNALVSAIELRPLR